MRVLPCGSRAVLVELDNLDDVLAMHAAVTADPPVGVTEVIPAARTLLVVFAGPMTHEQLVADLLERRGKAAPAVPAAAVEIPVRYDGSDLADVAELTGLSAREIVEHHTKNVYSVAFCGFSPGFSYLTGLDAVLHVPRRNSPRTRVPAGSVGLAGEFTGVYPRQSPGGWQLIGHTEAVLWDPDRDPPALLPPGTTVRFVEVP
jgi:5-oxoprolinase (ATP-hydrolysing) subunit B